MRWDRRASLEALIISLVAATLLPACSISGFLLHGLPQTRLGDLHEGDEAPDVTLVTLDGRRALLSDYLDDRPLVLIFGSIT